MKIKRLGKEYEYQYKTVLIYERNHRKLKEFAKQNNTSLNKMLTQLLKMYEENQ